MYSKSQVKQKFLPDWYLEACELGRSWRMSACVWNKKTQIPLQKFHFRCIILLPPIWKCCVYTFTAIYWEETDTSLWCSSVNNIHSMFVVYKFQLLKVKVHLDHFTKKMLFCVMFMFPIQPRCCGHILILIETPSTNILYINSFPQLLIWNKIKRAINIHLIIIIIITIIIIIIIIIINNVIKIRVGQVANAARLLTTGWTARVRFQGRRECRIFSLFVSRLVLGSAQRPIR